MEDCIFCKILKKEIPSTMIYEDDKVYAFNDIHPEAPVHVLIIPKLHISTLNDVNVDNAYLISHVYLVAKDIAKKLGIDKTGYRIISNCGGDAGQTVFHIHFHLLGGEKLNTSLA